MKGRSGKKIYILLFLVFVAGIMENTVRERSHASILKEYTYEGEAFREQYLPVSLYNKIHQKKNFSEILTATMLNGKFFPEKISGEDEVYIKYKKEEFSVLQRFYEAIWADVKCFPIPASEIAYEDTFGEPRMYGGERIHEGTDLFGKVKTPGYYPVLSMTDGIVEKIGWLPLGGYRIGIRTPGGAYFYYAHLSSYEKDFVEGEPIHAGEIVGYMGNTGYGEKGTAGKFPVHLHLGIYIKTPHYKELSVNPYWVLKASEKNIRKYTY